MRTLRHFRRIPALLVVLFVLSLSGSFAVPGAAQVRIPSEALLDSAQLEQILAEGAALEQQQRWAEALTHYENALRQFPGVPQLRERLTLARIHYDLARRYHDHSFLDALARITHRQALDLYAEVLLKIQAHYVDAPNWNELVRHGTQAMDVALSDPVFIERHLAGVDAEKLLAVRREASRVIGSRWARDRHEARDAVAYAAEYFAQQLGLARQAVVMEYTCGAIGALDMYSSFLTAAQLDEVMSQIEGNFVGLGVELRADDGALRIVDVIAGGPADRAGIRPGDRIVAVDGKSTAEMSLDAAADMLRGPEGSLVVVTVVGQDDSPRRIQVRRERVEIPSVEDVKILDPQYGVAYLRLTSFQKTTVREFDNALWKLYRQGMRSLIVDVRGNPGGLLTAAVEVADKFVSSGTIVSTRGRSPQEDFDYKAHSTGTWRVPLIVLVDGDSASASEIFAAAIRDHQRGTVVGQRTYGKGSVQGIFPLSVEKGGLRLTTAKFYSPSGTPISHRGVQPDVLVRTVAKPANGSTDDGTDPILQAGLQIARTQLSQRSPR